MCVQLSYFQSSWPRPRSLFSPLRRVLNAQMSIGISIGFAPPALPQYYQPEATQPNMIWQPGYWGFGQGGFFWVPGTWVQAPQVGLLWTPGYWGWNNGQYNWNPGYWGRNVGYYGGINYGYGYYGQGYRGGRWDGNSFQLQHLGDTRKPVDVAQ